MSIELVKQLRDKTGVSIMQCKKALEEAGGDLEKALVNLTKKSGEIAAKKGDRDLGSGVIVVVSKDGKTIISEIACETDFVAGNEDFKVLGSDISEMILEGLSKEDEKVTAALAEGTQKFGERIEVVRTDIKEGNTGSYVHSNSSVGSVVAFENEVTEEMAKDVAMHIAAQNPKYLLESDIDEAEREKAMEALKEEVADKPAEMQEKILEGKINAYFKERVLMSQSFIKNPDQTIENLVGDNKVVGFTRFGVGEA